MEMLRIISMMMVLIVHADGAALGLPTLNGNLTSASAYDIWRLAIEAITIIGVNCFIMISGYFGIRLTLKGTASFIFQCTFYAVGIYTTVGIVFPQILSWDKWIESWMVLSHTDLWFVPTYFGLMLLSPVLNAGLETISRSQFRIVLTTFTLMNIWCGWGWHASFNPTGYTLVQFILIYMIARYIRIHVDETKTHKNRMIFIIVYIASTVGTMIMSMFIAPLKAFAYNSPLVLLSTISLFLIFITIRFNSKAINYIARSAFAAYLIHKAPLIWGNIMKPSIIKLEETLPAWAFILATSGIIIGFYLLAMIIDPIRRIISEKLFGKS